MFEQGKKIRILKKPEVSELDGEKVMIDFTNGKYFMIKGAGNDIWDEINDGVQVSEIVEALLQEYDVERKTCENEVWKFLKQMEEYKFIELV